MPGPLDYLPSASTVVPAGVGVLATVLAWVGRDHMRRDDTRFGYMATALKELGTKLDSAIEKQADNHTEILKLLITPVSKRQIEP